MAGRMDGTQGALDALRRLTGNPAAEFRDGQLEAIESLVSRKEKVLVVQRTGWGKSAVYFVATELLRKQGFGPTIIVSPLLVLMDNQIEAARRLGLRAYTLNSLGDLSVDDVVGRLRSNAMDVLLISPERLANPEFADKVMPLIGARPGLLVIDEVHCVSDWGLDFRPDYRRLAQLINSLPAGIPVLGTTATANDRVVADVRTQMGDSVPVVRGPLRRESLSLNVVETTSRAARMVWLDKNLEQMGGSGIVYCLTVRDADTVHRYLSERGHNVLRYHADLSKEERDGAVEAFLRNEVKALVATTALGMGYDKPDVAFVVHYQSPGSVVTYYQQVGRAGRAVPNAVAVLMRGAEDSDILDYFAAGSFPSEDTVDKILAVFDENNGPVSTQKIEASVNLRASAIESALKQLHVEGIVDRVRGKTYERTLKKWSYPAKRLEGVLESRRREQRQMADYFAHRDCRMVYLTAALDDPDTAPCGRCDNCTGIQMKADFSASEIAAAERVLRGTYLVIESRKQDGNRRAIPESERLEAGFALSQWRDGGYGDLVAEGKQSKKSFSDELVDGASDLVRSWSPAPAPTWVTCVPSSRSGQLVPDFARRLAQKLGLPFHDVVTKTRTTQTQKKMENSRFQHDNVAGAFKCAGKIPKGPVLLVDDLVDSRWTLTEVGRVLRRAGAPAVFPVALSRTQPRNQE